MFSLRRFLAALRPPSDPYSRSVVALERGEPAAAVAGFTAALHEASSDETRVRIYNKRGIAYLKLGRRDDALRDFTEALALDGRFAPTITNIGNLLFEDGAVDDAVEHYEAAIRADESYAFAHLNLGIALRKLGKRAAAVRELRLAGRLEGRRFLKR